MALREESSFARTIARLVGSVAGWTGRAVKGEVVKRTGGAARARVITLFALVLALNGADTSTVGAIAPQLEPALHIDSTELALLSSVSLLVGALVTIPVGLLVDRTKRMPLLEVSIVLWSLASLFSALAGSFTSLLLTRLALGAVAASAGPAISSLTGDYFAADERGRIWSYILVGEAAGAAFGFIISGFLASLIDWRAAFLVLAIPGFFLARELWRTVPEPLRGGQSHLDVGTADLDAAVAQAAANARARREEPDTTVVEEEPGSAPTATLPVGARAAAAPDPRLILREDPSRMSLVRSARYIFSIPSNLNMIVGSSLGYFYLAGLSLFALLFVKGQYHASQATAELVLVLIVLGSIVGTIAGGRLTDLMLNRGYLGARVWFPGVCYLASAALLLVGFLGSHLTPAVWFFVAGAALISAANPPIQAARLDIVPAGLWGRTTSALTVVRNLAQAIGPLVFGGVSDLIEGIFPPEAPIATVGTHTHAASTSATNGLQISFLIMLAALVAAAFFLFRARTTFASDVAAAAASEPSVASPPPREPRPLGHSL